MPTTDQGAGDPPDVTTELRHAEALLKTGALQSAIFDSVNFSSFATDAQRDHHRVKQTIYDLLSNAVKFAVAHHPRHPACRYGRLAGPEPPPRGRAPEAERQGDGACGTRGSSSSSSPYSKGARFEIYLPRVDSEVEQPRRSLPLVECRGTETLLLVDDDEQVRLVARSILRRHGYRVIDAKHAGEALLYCEQHPGTIDLLVTDVVMPQMSGPDLAKRLAKDRPDMRVLCMSGYTDESVSQRGIPGTEMAYLQKPITPESLTRKVREVLDG